MTLGELKAKALGLIDRLSIDGRDISPIYNGQGDLIRRIPLLAADGLILLAASVCPLLSEKEYDSRRDALAVEGEFISYALPGDRIKSLPPGAFGEGPGEIPIWLRSESFLAPAVERKIRLEYARMPALPDENAGDDYVLDCNGAASAALPYYVAAHLALSFDASLYGALMDEFEAMTRAFKPGPFAEAGRITDVYFYI